MRLAIAIASHNERNGSSLKTIDEWDAIAVESVGKQVPRKRLITTLDMCGISLKRPKVDTYVVNSKHVSKDKTRQFARVVANMAREIGYEFPPQDAEVIRKLVMGLKWDDTEEREHDGRQPV